jgi:hypothetical protein
MNWYTAQNTPVTPTTSQNLTQNNTFAGTGSGPVGVGRTVPDVSQP